MKASGICLVAFAVLATSMATSASAQNLFGRIHVAVPFVALPAVAGEYTPHVIHGTERFLVQQITPLKSVTLEEDLVAPVRSGDRTFASGKQLMLAQGADGQEYYCSSYSPTLNWYQRLDNVTDFEWACFQDTDSDGTFDRVFWTLRNFSHSKMPLFTDLIDGRPVKTTAHYVHDQTPPVLYERSFGTVVRDTTRVSFYLGFREAGSEGWMALSTSDNAGTTQSIKIEDLPQDVIVLGAHFRALSVDGSDVTVQGVDQRPQVFALSAH